MNNKKITVFTGVCGSGKDFHSNDITENGGMKIAFADPMREDLWLLLGWRPKNDAEYQEWKTTEITSPQGIVMTGRDLMTRYGTEIRRRDDNDVWCKRTCQSIMDSLTMFDNVAISDARFENEIEFIKELGRFHEIETEFVFCDFRSDRYNPNIDHESEHLAQEFLNSYRFTNLDPQFDDFIKSRKLCDLSDSSLDFIQNL